MKKNKNRFLQVLIAFIIISPFVSVGANAASNKILSLRTGLQPGNKTRLVIETEKRPEYSLSYGDNSISVSIKDTKINNIINPNLKTGSLILSVNQNQAGGAAVIIANLSAPVKDIPKGGRMILAPNGDMGYRLVLDFVASNNINSNVPDAQVLQKKDTIKQLSPAKEKTPLVAVPIKVAPVKNVKKIIVIDAGHGGKDPGCIGKSGIKEKNIVLATAKKLKIKLDAAGYKTYLTRDTDVFLNLDTRAGLAEKHKADLFMSLHANANPSRAMQGFSVYTLSKKASDQEAEKLADAENASDKIDVDGFTRFEPDIRNALSSLQQHAVSDMSVEFGACVAKSFNKSGLTQQAGPAVRYAPFAVLRSTIPGVLIELGHLSNTAEEKLLNSDEYQNKLVNSILKSVNDYGFED